MEHQLLIYNTLTRTKELFKPINPGLVGMYVCVPTVYGDAHLGHARPAITFDLVFRYLKHLGYKVRYVRNITDVGHLEHDADEGEDKIAKKARLEQLEPMEIAQYYTNRFNAAMAKLNVLPPSIEPHATGHIIEQEELVQQILDNGFAYVSNGSVYFDVEKYNEKYHYGVLSGRNLDDVRDASRELDGAGETLRLELRIRNPYPYAIRVGADDTQLVMLWKHGRFRVDEFPTGETFTIPADSELTRGVTFTVLPQLAGETFDVGFALRREGYTNWFNGKSVPTEVGNL